MANEGFTRNVLYQGEVLFALFVKI